MSIFIKFSYVIKVFFLTVMLLLSVSSNHVRAEEGMYWFLSKSDIYKYQEGNNYGYKCLQKKWTRISSEYKETPGFVSEAECVEFLEARKLFRVNNEGGQWVYLLDHNVCINKKNYPEAKGLYDFIYYTKIECDSDMVYTEGQNVIHFIDGKQYLGDVENGKWNVYKTIPYGEVRDIYMTYDLFQPYYETEINRRQLYENTEVGGVRGGIIYDGEAISRGEFASMLRAGLHLPASLTGQNFTDINSNHKNYEAILTLKNYGIAEGKSDGFYHPEDTIPREEAVSLIVRGLIKLGLVSEENYSPIFSDVHENSVHRNNIYLLSKLKAISGYSDGEFKPNNQITRAQAAKIINSAHYALVDWLKTNKKERQIT